MTDNEFNELFSVANLSEPYAYANISSSTCSSSITHMLRVLLLLTIRSPTHELLAWVGLALTEEETGNYIWKKSMPAVSPHFKKTFNPSFFISFIHTHKVFKHTTVPFFFLLPSSITGRHIRNVWFAISISIGMHF